MSVAVERPRDDAPARDPEAPRPTKGPGAIPHFPGLEGLRGLAVIAVVAFHAQFTWARGGFLGVSTFFTLSGFLITSLLLNERGATGSINLREFWRRRFRRLMPAALATLTLVALFGWIAADAVQRRNLAGDVLSCLGYVANWRFLLAHQSYADIFGEASPVAHFWSLAIEEQFYLLLPLVAWFLLSRLRLGRGAFAAILGALTAGSLALGLSGVLSTETAYYHTGTRAAELLIGALVAVAVFDRRVTRPLGRNRAVQMGVCTAGVIALGASVFLWAVAEQSGDRSPWLYHGGFAFYSVLTAVVVLATVTPAGPVRWLLSLWPLTALGSISYGIYLYHWPIFLWLDEGHTGLSGFPLVAVRLAATLTLALLSYHLLESPIRHAGRTPGVRLGAFAVPAIAGLAVAVVGITLSAPKPVINFDDAAAQLAGAAKVSGPAAAIDTTKAEAPFPRISFFGDSTAMMTAIGMNAWGMETHRVEVVDSVARLGCGIGRGGERMDEHGNVSKVPDICNRWELEFRQAVENGQPTLAVVQIGPWEVAQRRLEGSDQWVGPGDPTYDKFITDEMLRAIDVLTAHGAVVAWLSAPHMRTDNINDPALRGKNADPARMDRLNELIRALPAQRPGKVQVVDLAGWLAGTGDDVRLRPDGVHFKDATSLEVARRYLGDALIDTYKKMWSERATADSTAGSDVAGRDALGRYLTNKYRALVVGDQTADLATEGMKTWGDKTGGLTLSTAVRRDCGILRTTAREGPSGAVEPTPPDCQSFRQAILDRVKAEKPDFVVIVPSARDLAPVRLAGASGTATWSDPSFIKSATQHLQDLVRQINDLGSVVLWANVPLGDPTLGGSGAAAKVVPSAPRSVNAGYNETLASVLNATPKGGGRLLDLANWTSRNLPALADGSDLTAGSRQALGEWLAAEAYMTYDGGAKLKPSPR